MFYSRYDATAELAASYWCCPQLGRLLMPPLIVRACGSPARRGGGDHFCERGASDAAAEETDARETKQFTTRRKIPRKPDCAFANREPRTVNVQS